MKRKYKKVTYKKKPRAKKAYKYQKKSAALFSKGVEVKCCDFPNVELGLNTSGGAACINLVNNGAAFYNRVGNKIEMKSLEVHGCLKPFDTQTQDNMACGRILIVYDRQPSASSTIPTLNQVIKSIDNVGGATSTYQDFVNIDNRDRFQILRDMKFSLPWVKYTSNATTDMAGTAIHIPGAGDEFQVNEYIKLKGLCTQFSGTGTEMTPISVANVTTGSLLVYTLGNLASDKVGWLARLNFRLRYVDI